MFCYPILRNLLCGTAILMVVWSCQPTDSDAPAGNATQKKTESPQQLTSPAEVTAALEARWSLDDIKTYCIPETACKPDLPEPGNRRWRDLEGSALRKCTDRL